MEEVRFFVGNIPSRTTENDLSKEFGYYGVVKSVELKRKSDENCYGFVNIEIEEKLISKCIREFQQQQFMGNYLSVTRAKESFLDRLKKEREGNTIGSKLLELSMKSSEEFKEVKISPKFDLPTIQKEVSSDESSSESEEEEVVVPVKQQKVVPTPVEPKKLDQATIDDMKRQKSLQKMKEINKEKRDAIKNALSSIDSALRNNKIIFEKPEPVEKTPIIKANLFDDDEEMEEETPESFKLKKQFEGRKGEKLFELQSRFQGDKRFQIDEKFAEVSDDIIDSRKKYTREELKERKKFRKEMQDWDQNEMKEERDHQLSILESITGEATGVTDKFSKPAQKGMLRFDPTKKSHQKYLDVVKGDEDLDDDDSNEGENVQQTQKVGEDRFYEVSDNLSQALQAKSDSKPFSIFGMLGIEHRSDDENVENPQEEVEIKLPPKINAFHLAKFKYESSDTDEEVEAAKTAKKKKVKPQKVTKYGKYSKTGVFHYNFFFRDDDPRLKEGLKFLIKSESTETPEALQEKRQKLKSIVKNSIRKAKKDQSAKQGYSKKRKVK